MYIVPHIGTEGIHTPVPIKTSQPIAPALLQGNEMWREVSYSCLSLSHSLRKFCDDCDTVHYQKAPLLIHSKLTILAYQGVVTERVPVETFRKKQLYINDLQLRIREELTNFDASVRRVEEEFDVQLRKLTVKKEEILRDLQTQRVKLVSILNTFRQEIEEKKYVERLKVSTMLDKYLTSGFLA